MSDFRNFFDTAPSDQNALDIFAGEWSSRPPASRPDLKAGNTPLFDDPRIRWAQDRFAELGLAGGFAGRDVLELGPLEGGQTYVMDRLGAKSITAVEANSRAFLKCLTAKEIFGMPSTRFLLGDALAYLRQTDRTFDVAVACGILYHLTNPVELLELLGRRCRALFLWTVYFDPEFIAKNPSSGIKFSESVSSEHAGYRHTLHRFDYGASLEWKGFCGGGESCSYWMEAPEILGALKYFGFANLRLEYEANIHGSALMLAARKA